MRNLVRLRIRPVVGTIKSGLKTKEKELPARNLAREFTLRTKGNNEKRCTRKHWSDLAKAAEQKHPKADPLFPLCGAKVPQIRGCSSRSVVSRKQPEGGWEMARTTGGVAE